MGEILIGTCSWTDPELVNAGTFYPAKGMSAENRLRFYASVFPIVEVDSTYYAIPLAQQATLWAERTPPGFIFDLKAFRLMTLHWCEPKVLPPELRPLAPAGKKRFYWKEASPELRDGVVDSFKKVLTPLATAHKLGLVLLQLRSWIGPADAVLNHILEMQRKLAPHKIAVEFRHIAWFLGTRREETMSLLRYNDLAYVAVDEPQGYKSSVPPIIDVTSKADSYIRFHGRNVEMWEAKGQTAADRFDWRYTEAELWEWVPKLEFLASQTERVHVLFNTNRSDQGPRNGMLMGRLLGRGIALDAGAIAALQRRLLLEE